jgi:hypothetical protein
MEGTMMKTTLAGRLLVMTMLAELLMASLVVAQKEDQPEARTQAVHRGQLMQGGIQTYANVLLNPGQLDNAEVRGAYERLVRDYAGQSDHLAAARTQLAVPAQPVGPGDGYAMIAPVSVDGGSVRLGTMFPPTAPRDLSRLTAFRGMPPWVWCLLHIRFCKNF